jgi:hypothetical protein
MEEAGRSRRRIRLVGVLLLALCVGVGFAAGDAGAKKKKKKAPSVFSQTVNVNQAVPDIPPVSAPSVPLVSTLTVGKKFKGKTVGDLNVTGIQTTGSGTGAASDLAFNLTAPNGRTVLLDGASVGDVSIGPLTLDDDTPTSICDDTTLTCDDPNATLLQPFAGTANLLNFRNGDSGPLSVFNGIPMRGTWTFRIWDNSTPGTTSVLNKWGLQITAARPVSP